MLDMESLKSAFARHQHRARRDLALPPEALPQMAQQHRRDGPAHDRGREGHREARTQHERVRRLELEVGRARLKRTTNESPTTEGAYGCNDIAELTTFIVALISPGFVVTACSDGLGEDPSRSIRPKPSSAYNELAGRDRLAR